jgi:hypothetical protein
MAGLGEGEGGGMFGDTGPDKTGDCPIRCWLALVGYRPRLWGSRTLFFVPVSLSPPQATWTIAKGLPTPLARPSRSFYRALFLGLARGISPTHAVLEIYVQIYQTTVVFIAGETDRDRKT